MPDGLSHRIQIFKAITKGTQGTLKEPKSSLKPSALVLHAVSTFQIEADSLTKTARQNWLAATPPPFKPDLVVRIYNSELAGKREDAPKLRRIMLLEISQYLENYLIPNFHEVYFPLPIPRMLIDCTVDFQEAGWSYLKNHPTRSGFMVIKVHLIARVHFGEIKMFPLK